MISKERYIVINSPLNKYNGLTGHIDKRVPCYTSNREVMFYTDPGLLPFRFRISEKDIEKIEE